MEAHQAAIIIAGSSPVPDPCSDSSASTMLPSRLPESNYYIVFTKANSPSDPYASKTKLPPISGTLSSLHRSILLQALILPHRNYLHQSLFPHAPAQLDGAETVAEKLLTTAFS